MGIRPVIDDLSTGVHATILPAPLVAHNLLGLRPTGSRAGATRVTIVMLKHNLRDFAPATRGLGKGHSTQHLSLAQIPRKEMRPLLIFRRPSGAGVLACVSPCRAVSQSWDC